MFRILVLDGDAQEQSILRQVLHEYQIIPAHDLPEAWDVISLSIPDLILMEMNLPEEKSLRFLSQLQQLPIAPPVIILSGESDPSVVVRAVKEGAQHFIEKPYNPRYLKRMIEQSIADQQFLQQYPSGRIENSLDQIIGSSKAIAGIKKLIGLYAVTKLPVLVTGESGTGKELIARTLHQMSCRSSEEYRIVHCGAIPPSLIESELYGTEAGAFTGAVTRPGYFEQAHGGTLFLDEIGELPLEGQVKLLRILEERQIVRVGGKKQIPIDTRLIAATNQPLKDLVKNGRFRKDLLYRLNTLVIPAPPLRKRKEDIPLLCHHFLKIRDSEAERISREAFLKLIHHEWPGNVRELRNVILRAEVLSRGELIRPAHVQLEQYDNPEQLTAAP